MAIRPGVGTCLYVTEEEPATYDEEGYSALEYTKVGEVSNPGSWGGEATIIEFQDVCSGTVKKSKGSVNFGDMELELAIDPDDGGQEILREFFLGTHRNDSMAFYVDDPYSTKWYSTGLVSTFEQDASGGPDEIYMGNVTLAVDRQFIQVPA